MTYASSQDQELQFLWLIAESYESYVNPNGGKGGLSILIEKRKGTLVIWLISSTPTLSPGEGKSN